MSLERFVTAQEDIYSQALGELEQGDKRSHWMWFIFPQIAGLGRSETARFYAIRDKEEAEAYLDHPTLGRRLRECTAAVLQWAGKRSAIEILGQVDALKFASCMTLFEAAGGGPPFSDALNVFYDGRRDERTLALLP